MKLFHFDIHLGKWRVLVQTRDINNHAVTAEKLADAAVTPRKLHPDVEQAWLNPILDARCACMQKQIDELRQIVTSHAAHGVALADSFGGGSDIGITQKTLTDEVNRIWDKLTEITGETGEGLDVTVTPMTFYEDEARVVITATALYERFEKLCVFVNGTLAIEEHNIDRISRELLLTDSSTIRTEAYVLGKYYSDTKIVSKVHQFYVGAGLQKEDITIPEYGHNYLGDIKGTYQVMVHEAGQRFMAVIPENMIGQATRMVMNGYTIPMAVERRDGYIIWTSTNTYPAETFTIGIE